MMEEPVPHEVVKGYGKSMPQSLKWARGKTNASVKFVQDAEKTIAKLQAKANELKAGREVIMEWLEITDFLIQKEIGI